MLAAENELQVAASGDESFANDVWMLKNVAVLIIFQITVEGNLRVYLPFRYSDRLQCIMCKRAVRIELCGCKT